MGQWDQHVPAQICSSSVVDLGDAEAVRDGWPP
jgi:hypothetical protein